MKPSICVIYNRQAKPYRRFIDCSFVVSGVAVPPEHGGRAARAARRLAVDRNRFIALVLRRPRALCPPHTYLGTDALPSSHFMTPFTNM